MADTRRFRSGPVTVRIRGKTISRDVALILYRCAECLGKLCRAGHGLACANGCPQKGFIHRREAEQIAQAQQEAEKEVGQFYKIEQGELIPTVSPLKEERNA